MSPDPMPAEADRQTKPPSWIWKQEWRDVLFAHWRVAAGIVRPFIPPPLRLDLRDDGAWVSAVAFNLETRRFGLCVRFPELNLRTYVRHHGEPGVFFLSLHAGHRLGVALARRLTPLPYFHAPMNCTRTHDAIVFNSPLLNLDGSLESTAREPYPDSLDEWLVERYTGFTCDRQGRIFKVAVSHPRWRLRDGAIRLRDATLGDRWGLDLNREPDACHFADGFAAQVGRFKLES